MFGKLFDSLDQEFAFNDWNDWEVLRTFSPHQADHIYDLWASKTGFDVKLKLTFHRGRDELKNQLWIMSTGFCAEDAFKNFHEQVERVVPLILNCCRRAYAADRNAEWFVQFEKELESLVGGSFGDQRSNESEDGADPDSANSQTEPLLFDERNFVSACLDSYFHDEDDELNERIRSSLQFLIQGTQQDSDAMKLVLFVGALEALICEGDHGIGGQLSRNIAALLQPNGIDRSAAMRGLEKLYKHRSSAAHRLAQPPDAESKRALDIASASLRAILEWRRHQELMELPVKWCELRAQLRDASETGRQMVGPTRNLGSLIGPAPQIDN
ncbi:MAG: hypothetical protein H8E66_24200 [Planctomycetes bacterium]|nr:hypothetical protein [Planctomycetota bacterium]